MVNNDDCTKNKNGHPQAEITENSSTHERVNTANGRVDTRVLLIICPVVLYGKKEFAFTQLNDGSTTTSWIGEIRRSDTDGDTEPLVDTRID